VAGHRAEREDDAFDVPPKRAVTAGEAPVNGTCEARAGERMSVNTQKSPTDPAPAVPMRTLPGFFFALLRHLARVL